MKKLIFTTLFIPVMVSCAKTEYKAGISIDISDGKSFSVADISDNFFYLQLDSTVLMPVIDEVTASGDYLFLFNSGSNPFNPASEGIFIATRDGKIVNALNKKGRGPNEYLDIGTFAYNPYGKYIIIHARSTHELIRYSVPELEFIDRWTIDGYCNGLIHLSSDDFIYVREAYTSDGSIEVLNAAKREFSNLPVEANYYSLEMAENMTFSSAGESSIYYARAGSNTSVFRIDSPTDIREEYYLNFGKYGTPQKYWQEGKDSDLDFEEIMFTGQYALLVHFFLDTPQLLSFWYYTSSEENYSQFYLFDKKSESKQVVERITIPGYNRPLTSVGLVDDFYVFCLYNHYFDKNSENADIKLKEAVENNTSDQPILLFLKPKMP